MATTASSVASAAMTTSTMAASAAVTKSGSVKSPLEPAYGTPALKPSPAKIMIEPAVIVVSENKSIRSPDIPVEVWAIIIVITGASVAVIGFTCAPGENQNPKEYQADSQPRDVP